MFDILIFMFTIYVIQSRVSTQSINVSLLYMLSASLHKLLLWFKNKIDDLDQIDTFYNDSGNWMDPLSNLILCETFASYLQKVTWYPGCEKEGDNSCRKDLKFARIVRWKNRQVVARSKAVNIKWFVKSNKLCHRYINSLVKTIQKGYTMQVNRRV